MIKISLKTLLSILIIVITLLLLVGCSCGGSQHSGNSSPDPELIDDETIDPDELSDFVEDYEITYQEDESVIIN
ncbi:MAG: hypothetical protein IKE94_03840 [Aeriscardovia sp.]|nr:hypothetical protein [Aeriscardovia sp.]